MTAVTLYDPRYMSWEAWSARMASVNFQNGPAGIEQPVPESKWKQWAAAFISPPANAVLSLPQPGMFKTWQAWAFAVNHVLSMVNP